MKPGPVYDHQGLPLDYIVVVDAGSMGSRVHIYNYPSLSVDKEDVAIPQHRDLVVSRLWPYPKVSKSGQAWSHKIRPGVSTFASKPGHVGSRHLHKLIKYAESVVPPSQIFRTPFFLHATGGMRLLSREDQQNILGAACKYVQKSSLFYVPDCSTHISVIPGETEGIFGWLALNHLILQNPRDIGPSSDTRGSASINRHPDHPHHYTFGLLDLGGASAQVAFRPNLTQSSEHAARLAEVALTNYSHVLDMTSAKTPLPPPSHDVYKVFSASFPNYGVREAKKSLLRLLGDKATHDPCSPRGLHVDLEEFDTTASSSSHKHGRRITGSGDFDKCSKLVKSLATGVHRYTIPGLEFNVNHFVGVSAYYDTLQDGFSMGGKYDHGKFKSKVRKFCHTSWDDIATQSQYRDMDKHKLKNLCFSAHWLIALVETGLHLPLDPAGRVDARDPSYDPSHDTLHDYLDPFQTAKRINGHEFSWTLGRALLYASAEGGRLAHLSGLGVLLPGQDQTWEHTADDARDAFILSGMPESSPQLNADTSSGGPSRVGGLLLLVSLVLVLVYILIGRGKRKLLHHSLKARWMRIRSGPRPYRPIPARVAEQFELEEAASTDESDFGDV